MLDQEKWLDKVISSFYNIVYLFFPKFNISILNLLSYNDFILCYYNIFLYLYVQFHINVISPYFNAIYFFNSPYLVIFVVFIFGDTYLSISFLFPLYNYLNHFTPYYTLLYRSLCNSIWYKLFLLRLERMKDIIIFIYNFLNFN